LQIAISFAQGRNAIRYGARKEENREMFSGSKNGNDAILKDLRKSISGTVLSDEISRVIYSSGASIYRVKPFAIVQPLDKTDIVKVVKYAGQRGIPLIARGGGTSRTGNELGEGILIDFTRHLNQVLEVDPRDKWAWVQPGLILASLNKTLAPHKLFFPIDPSTKDCCTIGGMIANNSSGPHAVRYGAMRDHVLSMEVVLSNGEVIPTDPVSLRGKEFKELKETKTLEGEIYRVIPDLLKRCSAALKSDKPFSLKNSSGYDLWRLKNSRQLDLTPLLVGSEGTLGIITEAKLSLSPLPGKTVSGLLYLDDLDRVGPATERILDLSPTMVEILERQIIDLVRNQKKEMAPYLPAGIEALLFVEFDGEDESEVREKFSRLEEDVIQRERLATNLKVAKDSRDGAMFERVRSISGPILNKVKGPKKPLAFIEDGAVHPSRLSEYLKGLREIFKAEGVEASIYGHAGDGNLHVMVFLDLGREEDVKKMSSVTAACYDLILRLKGTISGEHGDGRLRTDFVKKQYPTLFPAMVEIKDLFDPKRILNPGCIVGGEEPVLAKDLKRSNGSGPPLDAASRLGEESVRRDIEACSGCGKCRSYCPIAKTLREESSMGRAKATLLREFFFGSLDPRVLSSPEFKKLMDSCLNCKRCLTECPTGVDIPWIALSGRAHYLERHGESVRSRLYSSTRFLCRTTNLLASLINATSSFAPARKVLEKTIGLDGRRILPPFGRQTLAQLLKGRPSSGRGRTVAYFPGCETNFNGPHLDGIATVEVLEQNGFDVVVPEFHCCGISKINSGAIRRAMADLKANAERMSSFAEQGIDVVFSEPSCALAVKMEYPKILGSEKAGLVSEHCHDIHRFLSALHGRGEMNLKLGEIEATVGYHNPCHLRALGVLREPAELLRLIPGIKVKEYPDGCCGLVGTFGMKRENFDLSMAIGEGLFEEIKASGVDEIATPCGACRLQVLQGTSRKAVSPISLLARSYRAASPAFRGAPSEYTEIQ
jgi:anaerobic glycerol-3-phosphate dehydrogenase C subunit